MPEDFEKYSVIEQQAEMSSDDNHEDPHEAAEESNVPQRRASVRLRNCPKKPRFEETHSSSEDDPSPNADDDSDDDGGGGGGDYSDSSLSCSSVSGKKSPTRRSLYKQSSTKNEKGSAISTEKSTKCEESPEKTEQTYVVLKTDIVKGVYPNLWKIDGKSLLQKFVPFQEGDQTLYKNTSVYSGWTLHSRDKYVDAAVKLIRRNARETVVHLNIDEFPDDND